MRTLRWIRMLVVNGFKSSKTSCLRRSRITLRRVLAAAFLLMFVGSLVSYASDGLELIQAARRGDVAKVTSLLANGTDVNAKDNYGETALMKASILGHSEILQLLKKAGAKE